MNQLKFYSFNNYYNRTIKKFDTIAEYGTPLFTINNVNFIQGDNITTVQVINYDLDQNEDPDYMILMDPTGTNIISRWFVIDSNKLRIGQFKLSLKRDIIADNYAPLLNAPMFVEKATINEHDPAIYNKENMTYNQIKESEYLLKDKTESAWLVGYIAKNYGEDQDFKISTYYDYSYDSINEYPYISYVNKDTICTGTNGNNIIYNFYYQELSGNDNTVRKVTISSDKNHYDESTNIIGASNGYKINIINYHSVNRVKQEITNRIQNTNFPDLTGEIPSTYAKVNSYIYNKLKSENGKVIKIGSAYKKINVTIVDGNNTNYFYYTENTIGRTGCIYGDDIFYSMVTTDPHNMNFKYFINSWDSIIRVTLDTIDQSTPDQVGVKFSDSRVSCIGQSFDMFCMPYSDNIEFDNLTKIPEHPDGTDNSIQYLKSSSNNNMSIINGLASIPDVVYDVQILPYCPLIKNSVKDLNTGVIKFDTSDWSVNDYSYIQSCTKTAETNNGVTTYTYTWGSVKGIIIWCSRNTFSLSINYPCLVSNIKQQNETDLWRINSPNWNGSFEFSLVKNIGIGSINDYFKINVDCAYKPYTPYIHVAPEFDGLYGRKLNGDAIGCICGGDFSLTSVKDQWSSYQINNKNYQAIFDRNIEKMEFDKKMGVEKDITGIISSGLQGGVTGTSSGNPAIALAGVGVGIAAGVANTVMNVKTNNEAIDYKMDQFGFDMGNIQALPNSLTKVSSLNPNNKIFPFIEHYTCTDTEKQALQNKLHYNGMTVGRIGTINEFLQPEPSYIKGKLIRLENTDNDFHELLAIADELDKGVFI